MKMLQIFKKMYLQLLNQQKNILAQQYHGVWIEISNKTQIQHFNKRVKNKERNSYNIDDILVIIKRRNR